MKQWLSWIILLFPFLLIGQIVNKEIKGVVLDEHNQAVSETEVYLLELDLKTTTDSQGKFLFSKVPEGNYTLYAIKKETLQEGILPLANSDIGNKLTISIAAKEKILDNITIQARKKSEILQHAAIKANIVNIQTDVLKSSSIDEIINRTPGVKIRNTGGLGANSNIIVGGFTGNAVRFLLDDIPIDYLGSSYGLNKIPTNMVERAEIYKGVLPSKIGIDALGSAINLVSVQKKKTGAVISYETGSYQTRIGTINGNIKLTDNWFVGTNSFYN